MKRLPAAGAQPERRRTGNGIGKERLKGIAVLPELGSTEKPDFGLGLLCLADRQFYLSVGRCPLCA